MFKDNRERQNRFSIRKLTVGIASVLIGFVFMGINSQSVKAADINSGEQTQVAGDNGGGQNDPETTQPNKDQYPNNKKTAAPDTPKTSTDADKYSGKIAVKTDLTVPHHGATLSKPEDLITLTPEQKSEVKTKDDGNLDIDWNENGPTSSWNREVGQIAEGKIVINFKDNSTLSVEIPAEVVHSIADDYIDKNGKATIKTQEIDIPVGTDKSTLNPLKGITDENVIKQLLPNTSDTTRNAFTDVRNLDTSKATVGKTPFYPVHLLFTDGSVINNLMIPIRVVKQNNSDSETPSVPPTTPTTKRVDPTDEKAPDQQDLFNTVTRTIITTNPDGTTNTYKQSQTFKRYKIVYIDSGQVLSYGDWTPEDAVLDELDVPQLDGYTSLVDGQEGMTIPAVWVTPESTDLTISVSYQENNENSQEATSQNDESSAAGSKQKSKTHTLTAPTRADSLIASATGKHYVLNNGKWILAAGSTNNEVKEDNKQTSLPQTSATSSLAAYLGLAITLSAIGLGFSDRKKRKN